MVERAKRWRRLSPAEGDHRDEEILDHERGPQDNPAKVWGGNARSTERAVDDVSGNS
jgi:hypothetical protein